jgi:hypothetical protein
MTPEHFQSQVISALKGIEKTLKETSVNLGLRQGPVKKEPDPVEVVPERSPDKFTLAHVCIRTDKTKLMPYPAVFCSMCGDPKQSIDLFIEEGHFKQLEDLLKRLP